MLITDQLGELIEWLLPTSPGFRVHQLRVASDELTLLVASTHERGMLSSLWTIDRTGA